MATPKGKIAVPTGASDEVKALAQPSYVFDTLAGFVTTALAALSATQKFFMNFGTNKATLVPVALDLEGAVDDLTLLGDFVYDAETGEWSFASEGEGGAMADVDAALTALVAPAVPRFTPVSLMNRVADISARQPAVKLAAYSDQASPGTIRIYASGSSGMLMDADTAAVALAETAHITLDPNAEEDGQWFE